MINHVLRCPLLMQRVWEKGQERLIFPFSPLCLWYHSFQHQKQEDAGTFRGRETSRSQCFYRSFMMFGEFCLQENKRRTGWPRGAIQRLGPGFRGPCRGASLSEICVPAAPSGRCTGAPALLVVPQRARPSPSCSQGDGGWAGTCDLAAGLHHLEADPSSATAFWPNPRQDL